MTTTEQYAAAHGISARRVRTLASQGAIPAHRRGKTWVIDSEDRPARAAAPRSMGTAMRAHMIRALRAQSLDGLTGPDRVRVAKHLGQLRRADNPADLLRAWFRDQVPAGFTPGEVIVRQAHERRDDRVVALVRKPRRKFAITGDRLARVIADERAIHQWTVGDLAALADVEARDIIDLEKGKPGVRIGSTRAALRALGVQPLALPPVTVRPTP